MQKTYLLNILGVIALLALSLQACKKANGIDNNAELQKPYGLYVGSEKGALLNTNDGATFKTIFTADGFPMRAIITSGMNILFIKANVHYSVNNGQNFNYTYLNHNDFYTGFNIFVPWQQLILSATNQNRIYICSKLGKGVAYSDDNGKTWTTDNGYDIGINNNVITSITQTKNGAIYAHNLSTDSLYKKDNKNDNWSYVVKIGGLGSASNHLFYLTHNGDNLLLTDISGRDSIHTSSDGGVNWDGISGLPKNRILYCTNAPFDLTILVGTDSMGVYRYDGTKFVASNHGLSDNTVVYSIVGKEDIYKNGVSKKYVYAATNKGLYVSEDLGINWVLSLPGSFVAVF